MGGFLLQGIKAIRAAVPGEKLGWAADADLCPMETSLAPNSFAALPAHSRVWVYKSVTPFTLEQSAEIRRRGDAFTDAWASHGAMVPAAIEVLLDHFVVIGADLADMVICGGSVDKSVQLIKGLEQDLGLTLTDRMTVLYEQDGQVRGCGLQELEALIKSGTVNGETWVYDDLVPTKGELAARFRTALRNTWMARYL